MAKRERNYKWLVVALLWVVCFFNYADRQAIFSVFPLLKSEMNLSDVQLGIVGSSFMWVYSVAGVLGQIYGWRSSFYLFGACGIVYGIVLLLLLREPARRPSAARLDVNAGAANVITTVRELFGNPMVRLLTAVFVGANFVAM